MSPWAITPPVTRSSVRLDLREKSSFSFTFSFSLSFSPDFLFAEKDLLQPTSMHYSKPGENIYDNAPGQTAPSDMEVVNEAYKTGFSHTQTGTYDNTPNQKERTDCDFGQPCIK